MDVGEGSLHDVGDIVKRQASGAMCVSLFAIIISLVSIVFAIEAYVLAKKDTSVANLYQYCPAHDDCPVGFATFEEMRGLVEDLRTCKEMKK